MPNPTWHPVASSHIEAVAHDAEAGHLLVRFTSGGTYAYPGAGVEDLEAIRDAESPGSHFHHWKQGRESVKVEEP